MFRQIHTSIWSESWFEALSPDAKLIFLYLITQGNISACGHLIATQERIAFDTKISLEQVKVAVDSLYDKVHYANGSGFWIKRYFKWQGGGPHWLKAVSKAVLEMPEIFQDSFKDAYPMDTLSIPYAHPIDRGSAILKTPDTLSVIREENKREDNKK